jgi:hypothetical protein
LDAPSPFHDPIPLGVDLQRHLPPGCRSVRTRPAGRKEWAVPVVSAALGCRIEIILGFITTCDSMPFIRAMRTCRGLPTKSPSSIIPSSGDAASRRVDVRSAPAKENRNPNGRARMRLVQDAPCAALKPPGRHFSNATLRLPLLLQLHGVEFVQWTNELHLGSTAKVVDRSGQKGSPGGGARTQPRRPRDQPPIHLGFVTRST